MSNQNWNDNSIQFPRLLAEISAVGLTPGQFEELAVAMDLSVEQIDELFERAECAFRQAIDGLDWEELDDKPDVDDGVRHRHCDRCVEQGGT